MPIEIQSDANWHPIWCQLTSNLIPIDIQCDGNWVPIRCQLTANRMTINTQSHANWLSIGCQWTPNLLEIESQSTNSVSIAVKNTRLVLIQVCKGTTLENFLRDLSTNEKPAFRALDQSEASISARFSLLAKSEVYQSKANVPIDCQWNVTELQLECQLNAKGLPIDVNWLLMECPSTTNGMPIDCQWIANWWPMEW